MLGGTHFLQNPVNSKQTPVAWKCPTSATTTPKPWMSIVIYDRCM